MNASEYQQAAARTLIEFPDHALTDEEYMIIWNVLGLAGEAGEVLDAVKKMVCHQDGLDRDKLANELGDVLWYVAAICSRLELDMGRVMEGNIAKLHRRYPDGYTPAASAARVDASQE